jgi:hypothetical protein
MTESEILAAAIAELAKELAIKAWRIFEEKNRKIKKGN